MTFLQVLQLEVFRKELENQITLERLEYEKASAKGKLYRMPMMSLMERGKFNVQAMTTAYYEIMHKEATAYSSNERKYIKDVCGLAYQRTIRALKEESEENDRNPLLRWVRHVVAWLQLKFGKNRKGSVITQ